jgi:N-acetylglucosamine malate deacetylase 1
MDSNEADYLDVIAVGAHPDDVEIGCGGTLARLGQLGYRVGIIDLTDGEPTPLCASPEIRLQESLEAAQILGVHRRHTLDLPNRELMDGIQPRLRLAKLFRTYRPKIVLGLLGMTPLASPDHWQARLITDAAVFYSRLSKWEDRLDGLPPHRIDQIYYYRLAAEVASASPSAHEFVMDISETLELKLMSIACYQTQFPQSKRYVFERVRGTASAVGQSAGFVAGESFVSAHAIGTKDLMRM